jgi:hypothetical protein
MWKGRDPFQELQRMDASAELEEERLDHSDVGGDTSPANREVS